MAALSIAVAMHLLITMNDNPFISLHAAPYSGTDPLLL